MELGFGGELGGTGTIMSIRGTGAGTLGFQMDLISTIYTSALIFFLFASILYKPPFIWAEVEVDVRVLRERSP